MVAGMKFLSKKGFNPQNMHNQKRVWEAKESKKQEEQKIRERQDQLKRERDDEELAKARGDPLHLKFMYSPPPGMEASSQANKHQETNDIQTKPDDVASRTEVQAGDDDITKVQAGDDPAAAAFRKMLASAASGHEQEDEQKQSARTENGRVGDGTVLQGTSIESETKGKGGLSALEKAVGRRDGNQSLSLDEQTARFPQLKNAPMAKGMSGSNVGVSFKPLGAQLRNVRCLACGIWGHSRGERECPKSGWNPFALKSAPAAAAAATESAPNTPKDSSQAQSTDRKSHHRKRGSDEREYSSQSSDSEDSYRERKRRKKSSKSKRRKKESKRSRKRYRSESPDRKRRRRERSESYSSDEDRAGRSRKSSKKSSRKESRRYRD